MAVTRMAALVASGLLVIASSIARSDTPQTTDPEQPSATPPGETSTSPPPEETSEQKAAPWLRPWLPPAAPDLNPILAHGNEVALQASLGSLISKFSTFPIMLTASGEYGHFVWSSKWQALSLQVVGKANLVFDHTTPEFAMIGGGLRRVGRRSGMGFGSVDYERLSIGPTFASRGSNLDVGLGAELAFGVLTFHGVGLGVFVDAYLFRPSEMLGPDSIMVIGLGYVQSARTGLTPSVAIAEPAPREETISDHPCPKLDAYRTALTQVRKQAVQACNARDTDACNDARSRVILLNDAMRACEQGQHVPPPEKAKYAP